MKFSIQYTAVIMVVVAALAWVALWYISKDILQQASVSSSAATSAQVESDRVAYKQRISSLASDTQNDRAALDEAAGTNIVSIVTLIEQAGARAGVQIKVNSAQAKGTPVALPQGGALSEVAFAVEADGSFEQVMRAAQTFERLSVPSKLEQIEFIKNSSDANKSGAWHLSALVGIFTTSAGS